MFERSPTIGWWFWTDRRTSAGFYRSRLLFWTSLANMFNPDYVSPNFQHKRAQNLRRCIRLCTHMVGLPLYRILGQSAHSLWVTMIGSTQIVSMIIFHSHRISPPSYTYYRKKVCRRYCTTIDYYFCNLRCEPNPIIILISASILRYTYLSWKQSLS